MGKLIPTVREDGLIWALKMGTNRLQALKFMGYTSVDAVCFPNSNELIKVGLYPREKDPTMTFDLSLVQYGE